jgi:hypothetical protein
MRDYLAHDAASEQDAVRFMMGLVRHLEAAGTRQDWLLFVLAAPGGRAVVRMAMREPDPTAVRSD